MNLKLTTTALWVALLTLASAASAQVVDPADVDFATVGRGDVTSKRLGDDLSALDSAHLAKLSADSAAFALKRASDSTALASAIEVAEGRLDASRKADSAAFAQVALEFANAIAGLPKPFSLPDSLLGERAFVDASFAHYGYDYVVTVATAGNPAYGMTDERWGRKTGGRADVARRTFSTPEGFAEVLDDLDSTSSWTYVPALDAVVQDETTRFNAFGNPDPAGETPLLRQVSVAHFDDAPTGTDESRSAQPYTYEVIDDDTEETLASFPAYDFTRAGHRYRVIGWEVDGVSVALDAVVDVDGLIDLLVANDEAGWEIVQGAFDGDVTIGKVDDAGRSYGAIQFFELLSAYEVALDVGIATVTGADLSRETAPAYDTTYLDLAPLAGETRPMSLVGPVPAGADPADYPQRFYTGPLGLAHALSLSSSVFPDDADDFEQWVYDAPADRIVSTRPIGGGYEDLTLNRRFDASDVYYALPFELGAGGANVSFVGRSEFVDTTASLKSAIADLRAALPEPAETVEIPYFDIAGVGLDPFYNEMEFTIDGAKVFQYRQFDDFDDAAAQMSAADANMTWVYDADAARISGDAPATSTYSTLGLTTDGGDDPVLYPVAFESAPVGDGDFVRSVAESARDSAEANAVRIGALETRPTVETTADILNAAGQTYLHPNGTTFTAATLQRTQSYLNTLVRQRLNATIDSLDAAKARIVALESAPEKIVSSGRATGMWSDGTFSSINYVQVDRVVTYFLTVRVTTDAQITLDLPKLWSHPDEDGATLTSIVSSRAQPIVTDGINAYTLSDTRIAIDRDDAIDNASTVSIQVSLYIEPS